PAEVKHPVHGPVGDLGRPLVVEQIEGPERETVDLRPRSGLAKIRRQAVAERADPSADAALRAVPAEQLTDLPANREQGSDGSRRGPLRIGGREGFNEQVEVLGAAGRPQGPDVLEPEVPGELVNPPRPGGVLVVRQPQGGPPLLTSRLSSSSPR